MFTQGSTVLSTNPQGYESTVIIGKENQNRNTFITPTNSLLTDSIVRLVGTNFDGTIKDTNFWTESIVGSGTVIQDGGIEISTGITANSSASYKSVRRARFVVTSALKFQGLFKFVTENTEDNIRRCGAYDDDNGYFFQLDGSTFSVGWRCDGVDTLVDSGSFNGNLGSDFIPINTNYYRLEIEWTPRGAFFYIDGSLLHKNNSGHLSCFLSLPITFESVNSNDNTTDVVFDCLAVAIARLGNLTTNSTYKYISTDTTTICKYGAGTLHNVIVLDNAGGIQIYDNTSGIGTLICDIDSSQGSEPLGTITFNAPFNDGLTIVTTGGARCTVTYE